MAVKTIVPVALAGAQVVGIDSHEMHELLSRHSAAKMRAEVAFHRAHRVAIDNCKVVYAFQFPDLNRDTSIDGLYKEVMSFHANRLDMATDGIPEYRAIPPSNPNHSARLSFAHCVSDLLPHLLDHYSGLIRMYTTEAAILKAYARSESTRLNSSHIQKSRMPSSA